MQCEVLRGCERSALHQFAERFSVGRNTLLPSLYYSVQVAPRAQPTKSNESISFFENFSPVISQFFKWVPFLCLQLFVPMEMTNCSFVGRIIGSDQISPQLPSRTSVTVPKIFRHNARALINHQSKTDKIDWNRQEELIIEGKRGNSSSSNVAKVS